jgi:hypothetical protein
VCCKEFRTDIWLAYILAFIFSTPIPSLILNRFFVASDKRREGFA